MQEIAQPSLTFIQYSLIITFSHQVYPKLWRDLPNGLYMTHAIALNFNKVPEFEWGTFGL